MLFNSYNIYFFTGAKHWETSSKYYLNYTILTVGLRETLQFKLENILNLALKEVPKWNFNSATVCRASTVCIAFFPLHVLGTTHSKLSTLM